MDWKAYATQLLGGSGGQGGGGGGGTTSSARADAGASQGNNGDVGLQIDPHILLGIVAVVVGLILFGGLALLAFLLRGGSR